MLKTKQNSRSIYHIVFRRDEKQKLSTEPFEPKRGSEWNIRNLSGSFEASMPSLKIWESRDREEFELFRHSLTVWGVIPQKLLYKKRSRRRQRTALIRASSSRAHVTLFRPHDLRSHSPSVHLPSLIVQCSFANERYEPATSTPWCRSKSAIMGTYQSQQRLHGWRCDISNDALK